MDEKRARDYWSFFAKECVRLEAPLYARISEGVCEDPEIVALSAGVKAGQPPANVLLAAVHYLLLRGEADHPLKFYFPNLAGRARAEDDPWPAFRNFCRKYRGALEPLIAGRVTNTNEVGRSAFLHAAFRALAAAEGEPLHLVEIGPSAGVNLIWDRYGVRYTRGDEAFLAGARQARLVIDMPLRGEALPPLGPSPAVATRLGLELNPVDVASREERDWLKALVWPDHVTRFARLDRALEILRADPPEIRAGDALELLPGVLGGIAPGGAVCVYHTMAVYQFSSAMKARLEEIFASASRVRTIHRLSLEWDGAQYPLLLAKYHDGARTERRLGFCDPQGAWLEWRG